MSQYDWEKDDYLIEIYQSELNSQKWGSAFLGSLVGIVTGVIAAFGAIYLAGDCINIGNARFCWMF